MHDAVSVHVAEALDDALHDPLHIRQLEPLELVYSLEERAALQQLSDDVDGGGGLEDLNNF
jgi:hypothetical protein